MTESEPFLIDSDQLRTAWKILQTLSDEFAISPAEQSFLTHAVTLIALRHLLLERQIDWSGGGRVRLLVGHDRVVAQETSEHPLALHRDLTEEETDAAYNLTEQILDRHEIPEHERAGLYSALPCLGLHALQSRYIRWTAPPPFKGTLPKPFRKKQRKGRRQR